MNPNIWKKIGKDHPPDKICGIVVLMQAGDFNSAMSFHGDGKGNWHDDNSAHSFATEFEEQFGDLYWCFTDDLFKQAKEDTE